MGCNGRAVVDHNNCGEQRKGNGTAVVHENNCRSPIERVLQIAECSWHECDGTAVVVTCRLNKFKGCS